MIRTRVAENDRKYSDTAEGQGPLAKVEWSVLEDHHHGLEGEEITAGACKLPV